MLDLLRFLLLTYTIEPLLSRSLLQWSQGSTCCASARALIKAWFGDPDAVIKCPRSHDRKNGHDDTSTDLGSCLLYLHSPQHREGWIRMRAKQSQAMIAVYSNFKIRDKFFPWPLRASDEIGHRLSNGLNSFVVTQYTVHGCE